MDLHDELSKHGAAASVDAARDLVSVEARESLGARVRRGRHLRVLGGTGVIAAVAVLGVVAWAALPGGQGVFNPAGAAEAWLDEEGAIQWSQGGAVVDAPFVLGPRMVIGPAAGDPLSCGTAWDYEPGAYAHVPEATESIQALAASFAFRENGEDIEAPPVAMLPEKFALLWQFAYRQGEVGPGVEFHVGSVAVADGVVVGRGAIGGGAGGGTVTSGEEAPFPGECHELFQTEFLAPYVPTDDGTYEQHLVIQFIHATTFEPVATFVDPAGSLSLNYQDLDLLIQYGPGPTGFDPTPDGPAALREPEGDVYQAFVVSKPVDPSCTPFADQRAQDQPGLHNVSYDVTIPGVQEVTAEWWGAEPVAMVEDGDFDPWYLDYAAWLLADHVSAGDPSPGVGWTRESNWGEPVSPDVGAWRLLGKAGTHGLPFMDPDCAFVQPIPQIEGAVWLIIDGADWATIDRENPGVDWATRDVTTWVYLGAVGAAARD